MINFKNVTENLIYIIATNLLTAFIVFNVVSKAKDESISLLIPAIEESFRKETNKIETHYKTEIKKLKNKKGNAEIKYIPDVNNKISHTKDTVKPKETKKRFRLFKKRYK